MLPWFCHAWAALPLQAAASSAFIQAVLSSPVSARSPTRISVPHVFQPTPSRSLKFVMERGLSAFTARFSSCDCSLRQCYTSQAAQLQGTDKFGAGRMAGWPWPPASVRWTMGWVWAVSGLAESSELKAGHCQLCSGWELIQRRRWENKHFPFTESSCQCNPFLRAALVPCLGSCQELGGGRWPIYSSA